jgi:predicted PurR-regulated permease PerM
MSGVLLSGLLRGDQAEPRRLTSCDDRIRRLTIPKNVYLDKTDPPLVPAADTAERVIESAGAEARHPEPIDLDLNVAAISMAGIFVLAFLWALYVAQPVVLPVVAAFVLRLLLQPICRVLVRFHVPKAIAALLTMAFLVMVVLAACAPLTSSATLWAQQLPEAVSRLSERLSLLREPIDLLQRLVRHAEKATNGGSTTVAIQHFDLVGWVVGGLGALTDGLVTTGLILFFMLIAGDKFLRRLVELLPTFRYKRQAIDISQQIESDISAYLITVSIMNVAVGVAVGITMYFCGMGDPLLWGVLALTLNYVPILGPLAGIGIFLLAGFLTFDNNWLATMPAALYLTIHVIEGEIITPLLLARRFTLNPVAVILALIFWYWMWGVPGAILAVPMLAITKILCDRVASLTPIGHMLED